MAGLKFTTDLDADALFKIAFRRAQDLGYTVREAGPRAIKCTQGNAAINMIAGALAPHCDFRIDVEAYDDGNELVLERNSSWWTGALNTARVKSKAAELVASVKAGVVEKGGTIRGEKEI